MSTNEKQASRIEQVCFMNMCMICDNAGNVLALDKVNDSYTGTTFPGGMAFIMYFFSIKQRNFQAS